jgi:hypothetical protein
LASAHRLPNVVVALMLPLLMPQVPYFSAKNTVFDSPSVIVARPTGPRLYVRVLLFVGSPNT